MTAIAKTELVAKHPALSAEMEKLDRSIREKCRQNLISSKIENNDIYYSCPVDESEIVQ